jgi:hypothetical protein
LRRVRVALLLLRFGTGQSLKALEAAEASCAIVATRPGVRGVAPLADAAVVMERPQELAARTVELLRDETRRLEAGGRARAIVASGFDRRQACARLAAVALGELPSH